MTLQQEIDHRIKNNLNMVSSILGLQLLRIKNGTDENSEEILQKSRSRIDALVIIHDALYGGNQSDKISFTSYVKTLSQKIIENSNKKLKMIVNAEDIDFPLEKLLELGIILNELITNSLKYAKESVEIHLKQEHDHCLLHYLEKGNTEANLQKIKESKKLGFKLIRLMVRQMRAEMTIKRNGDLGYTIRFKCGE